MKKIIFIFIFIIFYGCVDSKKELKMIEDIRKNCKGNFSIEYHKGNWNTYLKFLCDDLDKNVKIK